ncbi:MAG: Hpt domain-containing protein [Bacteroidetes bacterium]|nr:MAG: Hpt domain-containing protein [Bacteroidota bacterium]
MSQYIDLTYLHEISGGDAFIVKKTVEKFLESTPGILEKMTLHLQEEDYPELGKAAHKLKSSVAYMGIDSLRETILALEHSAKNQTNLAQVPGLVAEVHEVLQAAYGELRAAIAAL